ncbi:MAG TPA: alpha/beta fold hydrolase [Acetobacteraceae bacterium]|nr:alpha/beta fold hydrolase [Acetobacteraceae bacterium]
MFRPLLTLLLAMALLGGCAMPRPPHIDRAGALAQTSGYFTMTDGTKLPYRVWMPDEAPRAVVLALHGMNDSRDAWEYPAPDFTRAGIAVFSPDQRGFGTTPDRGLWAGGREMAADARQMARELRARYPHTKLILMGESMGAAVLMVLAAEQPPPPVDGYVLIAPAVWGRAEMNFFLRAGLWLFSNVTPSMTTDGGGLVHVEASDNFAAIRRLSDDPLTIHATRWDTISGLVNLMDAALADAPHFHGPALFLYGGHDELIPKRATAATWRAVPQGVREAYYPADYHLLLRDHERITPIDDILAWILRPDAPLPSGADHAAATWLAKQPRE